MSRKPYARTSLTIPASLLTEADRLAREWGRSRSWVFAAAIEGLVQSQRDDSTPAPDPPPAGPVAGGSRPADQILGFPTVESYREWALRIGGAAPPADRATTTRLRRCLDDEGASYLLAPDPLPGHQGIGEPAVLTIGTDLENARRLLRGLHRAGFALAREVIAGAVMGRAVTVVGVHPQVAIMVRTDPDQVSPAAASAPTRGVNST